MTNAYSLAIKTFPLVALVFLFQSSPAACSISNCYGCSSCGSGYNYNYCNSCTSASGWTCSGDGVLACGTCNNCFAGTCYGCTSFSCTSSSSWNSALAIGLIIGVGIPILIIIGVLICLCVRRKRQASYTSTTTTSQEMGPTGGYYHAPPAYPAGVYGGPPPVPSYTPAPVTGYPAMGYPQGDANCPPGYAAPGQPYQGVPAYAPQQHLGPPPPGYPTQ